MRLDSKHFKSIVPGNPMAVDAKFDLNFALRQLKKTIKDNRIIDRLHENTAYVKPSTNKRKQLDLAKFKQRKKDEEQS